jgi:uncharacterized protein with ACT and thioredoxin-like domain
MGGKISEMVRKLKEKTFLQWMFSEKIPSAFFVVMSIVVATVLFGVIFVLYFIDWFLRTTK